MGPQSRDGYVKGSPGLAAFTGIKDHRIHQRWREEGLPYHMVGNVYLYKKKDVERFIDKMYPEEISPIAKFKTAQRKMK